MIIHQFAQGNVVGSYELTGLSPFAERLLTNAHRRTMPLEYLIVHCTATDPVTTRYTPADLERDHRARGWLGIGYHFYITQDATVYQTRGIEDIGAHCQGYNLSSLGIAYEGGWDSVAAQPYDSLTAAQEGSLRELLTALHKRFPNAEIVGHRDMPGVHKACPCFDVARRFADLSTFAPTAN